MRDIKNKKFATAINCIDGRVQSPIIEWCQKEYKVDYVDMITEPGPDRILAENKESTLIESIKKRVEISIQKHASRIIVIVGHYDCAGNPVEKEKHLKHILSAIKTIKSWNFGVEIVGLWINEKWKVQKVF